MAKSEQRNSSTSTRFAQPATFMRLPHEADLSGVDVANVGAPFDSGTSSRSRAQLGPPEIRSQSPLIRPYTYLQKFSPYETLRVVDGGVINVPPAGSMNQFYALIEAGVRRVVDGGAIPMIVGGDHSI